ncbi:hypothetical protein ACA910_020567 [Epithemia clementina (nom. ined.)]
MLSLVVHYFVQSCLFVLLLLATLCKADHMEDKRETTWINTILMAVGRTLEPVAHRCDHAIQSQRQRGRGKPQRQQCRTTGQTTRFLCVATVFAMAARNDVRSTYSSPFDTDAQMVGVDNRCSGCITHVRSDIPGDVTPCRRAIKGFGGARMFNVWSGTIHWKWEDDQGVIHRMIIPNGFYVPEGKVRLLSPQHWAQGRKGAEHYGGAGEVTYGTHTELFWNNWECRKTIPLDLGGNNVATFPLAAGYENFHAYCTEAGISDHHAYDSYPFGQSELMCQAAAILEASLNDESIDDTSITPNDPWGGETGTNDQPRAFDLDGKTTTAETPHVILDEEERQTSTPTTDLLQQHYNFGHLTFAKLQEMAKQGVIPPRLAKCPVPVCSACQYAKATKRQWRSKTIRDQDTAKPPSRQGQVVSVDQLVSPTPGLIAQMTGFITKQRYQYATVYIDQATSLGFVYLQKTASADETLQGKRIFEWYAQNQGITIQAFHADNGIFKAKTWVLACEQQQQQLTFAAVGAHHANGKAERCIRKLQELAQTTLINAHKRWPKAITANLWPYALRHASDCLNAAPNLQHKSRLSPTQLFAQTTINVN